jgi:hypothetical protein
MNMLSLVGLAHNTCPVDAGLGDAFTAILFVVGGLSLWAASRLAFKPPLHDFARYIRRR